MTTAAEDHGPGKVIDLRTAEATDSDAGWVGALGGPVSISVVMPTLDEADNLRHVVPRLPSWIDELVLVDGGSQDDTVAVARRLYPGVVVVDEPRPGKGVALRTGFEASQGDIIVTLDADGSTDPAEMAAFVGPLLAGADLVKGTRFAQGGGTSDMDPLRRAGNWGLTRLVRAFFGGRYTDLCYGYAAFWRRALPLFDGVASGFEIETFMNVRALTNDLRVVEVPSFEAERIHGASHLRTFADGWRVLRTILRERASAGAASHRQRIRRGTGCRPDEVRSLLDPGGDLQPLVLPPTGSSGPGWADDGDDVFAGVGGGVPMEVGPYAEAAEGPSAPSGDGNGHANGNGSGKGRPNGSGGSH